MDTHFAAWLDEELRKRHIDKDADAARLFGVEQSTVNRWRTARKPPQADTIRKIATGLGVPQIAVLVAAGYLDADEVELTEVSTPIEDVPTSELMREISRRITDG